MVSVLPGGEQQHAGSWGDQQYDEEPHSGHHGHHGQAGVGGPDLTGQQCLVLNGI